MILNNVELSNIRLLSKIKTLDINITKENRTNYLNIYIPFYRIKIKAQIVEHRQFLLNIEWITDPHLIKKSVAEYLIANEYANLIYKNRTFYCMQLTYKLLFQML